MAIYDTSVNYFTNYDEKKNYYEVLFNPARAVQSNELIQLQTILRTQLSKFANHIFVNGTRVVGNEISVNTEKPFITIGSTTPTSPNQVSYDSMIGKSIIGSSGAEGVITHYDFATSKLFFDYKTGVFNTGDTFTSTGNSISAGTVLSVGKSLVASITDGISYVDGSFIIIPAADYIVDKNKSVGNYAIGLLTSQDAITQATDPSLADPANTTNLGAIGADRLKISANLIGYEEGVDTIHPDFIRLMTIVNGKTIQHQEKVKYADIIDLLAKRTHDESGNYTSSDFPLFIDKDLNDDTKLIVNLDPGTAYVNGYEVTTQTRNTLSLDKSRDTEFFNNKTIYSDYGYYTDVAETATGDNDMSGVFDIASNELVSLRTGINGTGTELGQCRITNVSKINGKVRLYLSEIGTLTGLFSSVKSISSVANSGIFANLKLSGALNTPTLHNGKIASFIFPLTDEIVKDVVNLETRYNVNLYYPSVATDVNGNATISPPLNTLFNGANPLVLLSNASNNQIINGAGFTFTGSNLTITGTGVVSGSIDVIVLGRKTSMSPATKTLTQYTDTFTTTNDGTLSDTIRILNQEDVFEIVSVTQDPSGAAIPVDVSTLTFDNGQTEFYYDNGKVSGLLPNTAYSIVYRAFSHNHSAGDFFAAQSYTDGTGTYTDMYANIKPYLSSTLGTAYNLTSCLDFRRKKSELSGNFHLLTPNAQLEADYNIYLRRKAKVYITDKGDFGIIYGTSSREPETSNDIDNSLNLYELELNPYTYDEKDVTITKLKTTRYTMKNISSLEDRINSLEYYSSLNLLEKKALDLNVTDSNGLNKFKNGIFVDNFSGHENSNIQDPEYSCALDDDAGELRPTFEIYHLDYETKQSTNTLTHEHTITLDYVPVVYAEQPFASEFSNVNPYNVFLWNGQLKLNPPSDNWMDTKTLPTVTRNIKGQNQNFAQIANFMGTRWNSWQTQWTSRQSLGTWKQFVAPRWGVNPIWRREIVTTGQSRNGFRLSVRPNTENINLGDRVLDTTIIPFIRAKDIVYTAHNMKPDVSNLKFYFDGVDVTSYCSVTNTDSAGSITGTFSLPNNNTHKFRTGDRDFLITDNLSSPSTSASAVYTASGLLQTKQSTIISVENPQVVRENLTQTKVTRSTSTRRIGWWDPLAETFLVDEKGGIFLDSVDLYFKSKDTSIPVNLTVVTTETGLPTQNKIPFSDVSLLPSQVNVSADASVSTNFKFSDPIYLKDGSEYAFVIYANSNKYEVWVGKIGGEDVLTSKRIDKNPYNGVFFKSQNASTWTPDQERDIKFKLNKCQFTTSSASHTFHNELLGVNNLPSTINATTMMNNIDIIEFDNTTVQQTYDFAGDVGGPKVLTNKTNVSLEDQKTLSVSHTNPRSLETNLTISTLNTNISPIINKNRSSVVLVDNTIVNDGDPNTTGILNKAGVYVSKEVKLINPSDDLKVTFDAIKPFGSDVFAYFKTKSYIPRYVTGSFDSGQDASTFESALQGEIVSIYKISDNTNTGAGATTQTAIAETTAIVAKADSGRVYLKSVEDVSKIQASSGIIDYRIIKAQGDIQIDYQWDAGGNYVIGDYVYHTPSAKIWKCIKTATTQEPNPISIYWEEVQSFKLTSGLLDDTETVWRPMKLDSQSSVSSVDIENLFVEYTYIPADVIDDEFTSFSIKLELRSNNSINIPRVRDLRVLAVY